MAVVSITVDSEGMVRALDRVENGLDQLVGLVAQDLANVAAQEAGQASTRLGNPWTITGGGPVTRNVVAPEWWAHFLAGGTRDHGPRTASMLVFGGGAGGEAIFAQFVQGIPADPFDKRAVTRATANVDDILNRLIASVT